MKKILVVDDEEGARYLIKTVLDNAGFDVIEAKSGKESLELLEKTVPDLVILDVMMPNMDGWEVCREIKSDPRSKDIPVLMLTIKDQALDFKISSASKADLHMTKPFHNERLVENVKSLLH